MRDEEVAELEAIVLACEAQPRLYTEAEAKAKTAAWIATQNEGGEGYVPHYYTIDEYERARPACSELEVGIMASDAQK